MNIWQTIKQFKREVELPESLVVVGLGNPGRAYAKTRHNVGRAALTFLATDADSTFSPWQTSLKFQGQLSEGVIGDRQVYLLLPDTYMNESGRSVDQFIKYHRGVEVVIVHDDLDLPVGKLKLSVGRGPGGHKGVLSIMAWVKDQNFKRIRVGIRPLSNSLTEPIEKFVLAPFTSTEEVEIEKTWVAVKEAIESLVTVGWPQTVEKIHRSAASIPETN